MRPAMCKDLPVTKGNQDGRENAAQHGLHKVALAAKSDQEANQGCKQIAEQVGPPKVAPPACEDAQDGDQSVEQPPASQGGVNVAQDPEQVWSHESTV